MRRTALISHPDCLLHVPPAGHPESPSRLTAVLDSLSGPDFEDLLRFDAPRGEDRDIERVHPRAHLDALESQLPKMTMRAIALDADTYLSSGSLEAARRGIGGVIIGVDGVMKGQFDRAFCATRPPGHHAEPSRAMGFCLFNTAAIGALYARAAYGLTRVAVVDVDVHHGNGSQEIAMTDPDFFYASIHQGGIYPSSGFAHETAFGNLVNVPLPEGTKSQRWQNGVETLILPALTKFAPDIVILSLGFDGHRLDPLAGFNLEAEDFAWVTGELLKLTGGKLVSTLEGGYHLEALGACARAHVSTLINYNKHAGGVPKRG
jgi:acetoin utilization deacetylase AcuC-like enzyme